MKISTKKLTAISIIFILFMAVFNDIIRFPNTVISGYRLLLPLVLCLALTNFHSTWRYFIIGISLLFCLIIQNIIFCYYLKYENTIDLLWQLRFIFYYFSIIAIFILIRILRKKDNIVFVSMFHKWIPFWGILCLLVYVLAIIRPFENVTFANWNNYAACLAAVFSWFLIEGLLGKKKNLLFCITILVVLWWGDSKAALAGIVIQIGVVFCIFFTKRVKEGNKLLLFLIPAVIGICLLIALSPIKINGYSIRIMFTNMLSHILKGETYSGNSSSLAWRTNAIIFMLNGIKSSHLIGIGIGNTGKLLRYSMPDIISHQKLGKIAISSHFALLEFLCDCGIWAIFLCIYIYIIAIKKLLQARKLNKIEMFFVAFTLSFPMWIMSPSGIYTTYLIFIIIAWLYEWSKWKHSYHV